MIINAILKVVFANDINNFMAQDLTTEYIDMQFYMNYVDFIASFDILIYMMLIAVIINVVFSWLPGVFGAVLALL